MIVAAIHMAAPVGASGAEPALDDDQIASAAAVTRMPCFGAAARDPLLRCEDERLRMTVFPSPDDAVLEPNSPCLLLGLTGLLNPCAFGSQRPARATVALIGDSHASHWRAAVDVVDMTRYFCDSARCYPVIGGALVHNDIDHITATFARTLGPFMVQKSATSHGSAADRRSSAAPTARLVDTLSDMESILSVVQVGLAIVVIFLVLMHSGKDAGLSGAFGVGTGAGPFGGGSLVERNLNRWTVGFAIAFFVNTIILLRI